MKVGKYNLHLHAMCVHFTNGLYPVAVLFLILYELFQQNAFRSTYFHLLLIASFSSLFSFVTGIIEWKQKYKGAKVKIFIRKYTYGLILIALGSVCAGWYTFYPEILGNTGGLHIVFILLNIVILPIVTYLGYLGGKLVFGGNQ